MMIFFEISRFFMNLSIFVVILILNLRFIPFALKNFRARIWIQGLDLDPDSTQNLDTYSTKLDPQHWKIMIFLC